VRAALRCFAALACWLLSRLGRALLAIHQHANRAATRPGRFGRRREPNRQRLQARRANRTADPSSRSSGCSSELLSALPGARLMSCTACTPSTWPSKYSARELQPTGVHTTPPYPSPRPALRLVAWRLLAARHHLRQKDAAAAALSC